MKPIEMLNLHKRLQLRKVYEISNFSDSPKVLVAGSKPNPVFPLTRPDIFVGAHGGICHSKLYCNDVLKWGIISNLTLSHGEEHIQKMWESIRGSYIDNLVIFESTSTSRETLDPREYIGITKSIVRISRPERTMLEFKSLGLSFTLNSIFYRKPHKAFGSLLQIMREHTFWRCRLSMGMLGAALAQDLFPNLQMLIIVGIGMQPAGSSHIYDPFGPPQGIGHIRQDRHLANRLISNARIKSVVFTDSEAKHVLKITDQHK